MGVVRGLRYCGEPGVVPNGFFRLRTSLGRSVGGRGSPQCGGPGVVRIESFSCARGGGEGAVVAIWKARFWTRWAFTRAVCWLTLLIIRP